MRVLVFGGDGFVGRHLVGALRSCDGVVARSAGRRGPAGGGSTDVACDLRDAMQVAEVIRSFRPEFVVNLAGAARGSASDLYATNVGGALNVMCGVLEHAPSAGVIQFGSAAEYGRAGGDVALDESIPPDPVGAYGHSKLAATMTLLRLGQEWGTRVVVLRPFNIVGAGCPTTLLVGALVARIRQSIREGAHVIAVGRVDTQRDFVAVEDVVDAVLGVLRVGGWPAIANVCSGEPVPIRRIVERLIEISGAPLAWRTDSSLVRGDDPETSFGSHACLSALTGFRPAVSIDEALRRAWHFGAVSTAT